jgi:hypothetical protein
LPDRQAKNGFPFGKVVNGELVLAILNGTEDDDNTSSGFLPFEDRLISSTYGGDDLVDVFSPAYRVNLGDGDDRLAAGGSGGSAYGGNGNDRLSAFL